jgi:hypothetical protein
VGAIQAVLLERTKQAELALAVALLEQGAEALCGRRYERKSPGQGHRGGHEQTSVVMKGRAMPCAARVYARRIAKWSYPR